MDKFLKTLGVFVLTLLFAGLLGMLSGLLVMMLWNWLMPMIFGLTEITYLEGWGLCILCGLLFKSNNYNNNKE